VGRELTKQFEQIATMPASQFSTWLAQDKHRASGEFALAIHPQAATQAAAGEGERLLKLLLAELPTKTAVKLAADISGEPRNALYEIALRIKGE
jgi:16S rRNA (cytidine1402-2'-O)-methyltransferase